MMVSTKISLYISSAKLGRIMMTVPRIFLELSGSQRLLPASLNPKGGRKGTEKMTENSMICTDVE